MKMVVTTKGFASFLKKKGFIYPSSEIYGGVAGLYDYGHLGTKLKHNFEDAWRKFFLTLNDNFHEIDTAQIMHEDVFEASGHLKNFIDPVAKCTKCDFTERADHLIEEKIKKRCEGLSPEQLAKLIKKHRIKCPKCNAGFKPVTIINMMFPVHAGVGTSHRSFLRPETAQSPYVNFKLQYEILRKKLPLGLAIIGKAYRNEISPRNLTLRQREFTQAELQIFFNPHKINEHPDFNTIKNYKLRTVLIEDRKKKKVVERTASALSKKFQKMYVYYLVKIQQFYLDELKIPKEKFRLYQLDDKEKAFYNKYHVDIEIKLNEHGFTEIGGLHYRTDHDLKGHQKVSKEKMEVHDEESRKRFIPHVLEISLGVDRSVYALLDVAYDDNKKRGNVIMHLPSTLSPFFCSVFPLVKNNKKIVEKAKRVYEDLRTCYSCFYDEASSVGRRYARADEMGVRYCITIDFESLDDDSVTIRDRENTKQERIKIKDLKNKLFELYLKK